MTESAYISTIPRSCWCTSDASCATRPASTSASSSCSLEKSLDKCLLVMSRTFVVSSDDDESGTRSSSPFGVFSSSWFSWGCERRGDCKQNIGAISCKVSISGLWVGEHYSINCTTHDMGDAQSERGLKSLRAVVADKEEVLLLVAWLDPLGLSSSDWHCSTQQLTLGVAVHSLIRRYHHLFVKSSSGSHSCYELSLPSNLVQVVVAL